MGNGLTHRSYSDRRAPLKPPSALPDPLAIFGSSQMMSWIYASNPDNTINTGRFEIFADGSTNGRTYEQTTAGSRAAQSSALGWPSALFSSARPDFYSLTGPSYGTPAAVHVIRIMKINADPPAGVSAGLDEIGTFAGAGSRIPFSDGNCYDATGATTTRRNVGNPSVSLASSPCVMYESTATAAKFEVRVNGGAPEGGTWPTSGVGITATPLIGATVITGSAYLDGHLMHHIMLNAEPSAGQRAAMAAWVLSLYGLVVG